MDRALAGSSTLKLAERAEVLFAAGDLAGFQGEMATSLSFLEHAVELARHLDERRILALALTRLAWVRVEHGLDLEESLALGEEGVRVARDLNDPGVLAESLRNASAVPDREGDPPRVIPELEESLALRRSIEDVTGVADSLLNLGWDAIVSEDYAKARGYLVESLDIANRFDDRQLIALAQGNLGLVELFDGDPVRADELLLANLRLCLEIGDRRLAEEALAGLAGAAARRSGWDRAAWLAGARARLAEENAILPSEVHERSDERYLIEARRALGEAAYEARFERGRAATFEEAMAYALGELGKSEVREDLDPATQAEQFMR
jgi:non-specific serine/threonine protein kinase